MPHRSHHPLATTERDTPVGVVTWRSLLSGSPCLACIERSHVLRMLTVASASASQRATVCTSPSIESPMSLATMNSCPASTLAPTGFTALPGALLASAVAPHLTTAEFFAAASTNRATRQLLLSPSLWRHKVFASFPPLPSSASSMPPSLPSWCEAVQVVQTNGFSESENRRGVKHPVDLGLSFCSLLFFPNLRRVKANNEILTRFRGRVCAPLPSVSSLATLRYLTHISLRAGGEINSRDLRLLSTLPVLASLDLESMVFEDGSDETLGQWMAVSARKHVVKGKARGEEVEGNEGNVEGKKEARDDADEALVYAGYHTEDANDPALPRRHTPLLLFLHSLAAKPSFVYLRLFSCGLTPFVMDHMPVWPYLLCLAVDNNETLDDYTFAQAAQRFPSLTSLSLPNCSDRAIQHLVQLPKLEELRFPRYVRSQMEGMRTTARGFGAFSQATSLRSLYYSPPEGFDGDTPSLASLTAVFTLPNLTRLTVSAGWLNETTCLQLFTEHRFEHLRCLELIEQYGSGYYYCLQTDAALLPLVKAADVVVAEREERQAARAAKRPNTRASNEVSKKQKRKVTVIPAGNAANFPVLECLALPYQFYGRTGWDCGRVTAWMRAQLRRSYEFEKADEWEQERVTLGVAELLKTLA